MHANLPTVREKLAAVLIAVLIFASPALAQWTADTVTGTPTLGTSSVSSTHKPARTHTVIAHQAEDDEPGWDCTVHGTVCGNGTGVDRQERKP